MSDTTLNQFLSRGTSAQRIAYTPVPPTPAAGPSPGYSWFETDTGLLYAWNGAAWQKASTGGTSSPIGMMLDGQDGDDGFQGPPGPTGPSGGGGGGGSGIPIPGGTAALGKRVTWAQKANGDNVSDILVVGQPATSITGGTGILDSSGFWSRTTSSSGGQASSSSNKYFTRVDLLPKLVVRLRTQSVLTTVRILVGLNNTADVGVGSAVNTDTPSTTTERGLYFRYSTVAGDGGWVAQTVDSVGRTLSGTILAIAASTIYVLTLTVISTTQVRFDVNGTFVDVTTNIPITDSLGWQLSVAATAAVTRSLDLESIYLESN